MTRCASFVGLAATLALTTRVALGSGGYDLYGITTVDDADHAMIVRIDTMTGAATPLFDLAIFGDLNTGSLAYSETAGALFGLLSHEDTASNRLLVISPSGGVGDSAPIAGLPSGEEKTSGIEWDELNDRLLITFGVSGGFEENRIARLSPGGTIEELSPDIGIGDIDTLGFDATTSQLVACDFNANDGFPRMVTLADIFGVPTWTEYGDPPSNGDVGDVAIHPTTGVAYIVGFDANSGDLIRLKGDAYVEVGPFDIGRQIVGIAFVPVICPADIDGCGVVDVNDLLLVLSAWGTNDPNADIAPNGGDGIVDVIDLLLVLGEWGPCG